MEEPISILFMYDALINVGAGVSIQKSDTSIWGYPAFLFYFWVID